MPKNVELLDNTNDILYPKTKTEQVIVTSTQNLNVKLTDIDTKIKSVTDEVVNARNKTGNTHRTLKARLDAMEDGSTNIQNTLNQVQATANQANTTANATKQEVEQARGGQANLNNRLNNMTNATTQAQQTATTANNTANNVKQEIDNAKAPNATLKEKLDSINGKFANYLPLAGGTVTGNLEVNRNLTNGGFNVWHEGNLKPNTFPARDSVAQRNASGNVNTSHSINMHSNTLGTTLDDTYIGSITINPQNRNLYHAYVAPGTTQNGTNQQIWTARDFTVSVNPTANTVVKRTADGDMEANKVICGNVWSQGLNLIIGGTFSTGATNGDVVFRTNMRPLTNSTQNIGSTNYRFGQCWVTTGQFNTSDERCKTNIETFDVEDCFNMVKNTDVKSYTLLTDDKTKMSDEELEVASLENEKKGVYQQLGIIAQDIVGYKCSDYILVQDNPEDLYAINPYNLTSAVMGALKVEIQKREELEERVKQLEELVAKLTA